MGGGGDEGVGGMGERDEWWGRGEVGGDIEWGGVVLSEVVGGEVGGVDAGKEQRGDIGGERGEKGEDDEDGGEGGVEDESKKNADDVEEDE